MFRIKRILTGFAQPLSPEKSRDWAGRGQFTIPDAVTDYPKKYTQKEYEQILEETGAKSLFGEDIPKLRKFYMPSLKNIVMIDGKEYFLVEVEKSKDVGRAPNKQHVDGYFQVFGPVSRKNNKNKTIDWSKTPTRPLNFSYDQYKDQIQRSPQIIQEKLDVINKFIADHNSFIEKDKKTANITTLPLQLARAERIISERLQNIQEIREELEEPSEKGKSKLQSAVEDIQSLRQDILSGRIIATPANYAISVLETKFHNTESLQELKQELTTLTPPFNPETNEILLKYLNRVVDEQIRKRQEEASKKSLEKEEREERKESDLPEMKDLLLKKIKNVEKLPGQYDKTPGYFGPEFVSSQSYEIGETTGRDYEELSAILGSLSHARQTITDLPKASNEYLLTDGKTRLNQVMSFIDNAKMFVKRYKEPVFVSSEDANVMEINPKLFSKTSASLGNAFVAVVLNQLIQSVEGEINRILEKETKVLVREPVETTPLREPVASISDKIKKLSEVLWKAFENRMR